MTVAVLEYGAGNVASVVKALAHLGAAPRLARRSDEVAAAGALVIPGVGHFARTQILGAAMRQVVRDTIARRRAVLGICLGLQWLFEGSDEAPDADGLGVFPGRCVRLTAADAPPVKVPHVGWNTIDAVGRPSRLLAGMPPGAFVYFTHAYAAPVCSNTTAVTAHGLVFSAIVERGPVAAVQFHPEKSGRAGLHLIENFLKLARESA